MKPARGDRRRRQRWTVGVWTATVVAVVGGALTLWLQDTNRQAERPDGRPTIQGPAAPLLHLDVDDPALREP